MGKKKVRKHQKEPNDSSHSSEDDETQCEPGVKSCPHLTRSINLNGVKKSLKSGALIGECQGCVNSKKSSTSLCGDDIIDFNESVVWLCLQCGNQGCDRNSSEQHSLLHYKTPRSDSHAVVINTISWTVWCYDCDDEVSTECNKKLQECVDFIRRQTSLGKLGPKFSKSPVTTPDSGDATSNNKDEELVKLNLNSLKHINEQSLTHSPKGSQNLKGDKTVKSLPSVKGLGNLGNTCFFNAVMQSLSQTFWLTHLLQDHCMDGIVVNLPGNKHELDHCIDCNEAKDKELLDPLDIQLPEAGPLTLALAKFFKLMHSPGNSTVNPSMLFNHISKKFPQFRGAKQQDSHELLRHLLDGLRMEEMKRQKTGILKAFGFSEKVDPNTVDENAKKRLKAYGRQATHTIVDVIFSGQLISTVLCEECHTSSQVFEPFLDLSLPVAEEKPLRPGLQRKHSGEGAALDSFGTKEEKRSQYQEKKSKKQARKEAKRNKPWNKNTKGNAISREVQLEKEGIQENGDNGSDKKEKRNSLESVQDAVDGEVSEPSDADEEDNAESESTVHSMRNDQGLSNSSQCAAENGDNSCAETRSADDLEDHADANEEEESTKSVSLSLGGSRDGDATEDAEDSQSTPLSSELQSPSTPTASANAGEGPGVASVHRALKTDSPRVEKLCTMMKDATIFDNRESHEDLNAAFMGDAEIDSATRSRVTKGKARKQSVSLDDGPDLDDACQRKREAKRKNGLPLDSRNRQQKQEWIARSLTTLSPRYHVESHECSILSCLNQFTASELLTGNNRFGCENCTRLRTERIKGKAEGKKPEVVYSNASKQLLIFSPPAVLTLHLKRFQQISFSLRKVNRHVDFPLLLDLAPFCSSECLGFSNMFLGQNQVLYSLYGVVEHSGRLTAGHYTAYVKVRSNDACSRWKHFLNHRPASQYDINRLVSEMAHKADWTSSQTDCSNDTEGCSPTPEPSKWFYISDSSVSEVTESTVLSSQAYLLFYERIL